VNHISDGDTIVVGTVRVRLYGIDAPETDQPYGDTAAQFVTEYLQDVRRVRVVVHDTDRFGRIVGEVFVPGREESLNHALVGAGYAWWYEYFAPEEDGLQMLQEKARQYNRGLWSRDDPVPPWEWRKQ
jgi:endonuclease YncB( thermonuclease family)